MKNEFIKWNDIYSVDDDYIDTETKKFISIINKLFNAFSEGNADSVTKVIIKELEVYSKNHFDIEEKYLKKNNFPKIIPHIISHSEFKSKIQDFDQQINSGKKNIHYEIIAYLKSWFNDHIIGEDVEFGKNI